MRFPVKPGMTTELEEDFVELLSDSDEFSPTFELFFEVDEPSPQAIRNRENKKRNKVFFITVNITHL